MTSRNVSRHHGLMGTVVEIQIEADGEQAVANAEQLIVAEIARLEDVFSVFRPDSELSLWRSGSAVKPGPELVGLLEESLKWQELSAGAYNPEAGVFTEVWEEAARAGGPPDEDELEALADSIRDPGYSIDRDEVTMHRPLRGLSLNAMAKGWIVDRACNAGRDVPGVTGAVVNAGGDLLNLGSRPLRVAIEDPHSRYDNIPPAAVVEVPERRALATSGGSRRGWEIDGDWHSHVIDPRNGRSAGHVASATVVAANAATADVVATILTVLQPAEGLGFVGRLDDVSCLVIAADGVFHASPGWASTEVS